MRVERIAWVIVVLSGLTALSCILASIFGAHAILLALGTSAFTIAAAPAASRLQERQSYRRRVRERREQELERQQETKRTLDRASLDRDCAELLRRAEAAVSSILDSEARTHDLLHSPIDEKELSDNVRAIFTAAREITDLRAKLRSISAESLSKGRATPDIPHKTSGANIPALPDLGDLFGGRRREDFFGRSGAGSRGQPVRKDAEIPAGPMTAEAIKPGQRAIEIALKSAESRVLNLERYALSVRKVDVTYKDWLGTQEVERLNPRFRELLAKTAEDKLAAEEFGRLARRAAEAEQAFRQSIHEADLAGEILALPDDKGLDIDEQGSAS